MDKKQPGHKILKPKWQAKLPRVPMWMAIGIVFFVLFDVLITITLNHERNKYNQLTTPPSIGTISW